jgi:hypothetical protein
MFMDENRQIHRRLQFSLQTMLILLTMAAIPLSWVGFQLNIIRQRREVLSGLDRRRALGLTSEGGIYLPGKKVFLSMQLFGEEGVKYICFQYVTDEELEQAKWLFPEADDIQRLYDTKAEFLADAPRRQAISEWREKHR